MRDYSHELKIARSPMLRWLFMAIAGMFLSLGILGLFLPLLPTTPFVILAAYFYARSSGRFYNWLMNHPQMGPPLRQWFRTGSISRRNKLMALGLMWPTIGVSWLLTTNGLVQLILPAVAVGLSIFLITRPEHNLDS